MGKTLKLSLLIKAIDHASGPLKRLNDRIEAMHAPLRRASLEMERFSNLSGLSTLRQGLSEVGREIGALTLKLTALSAGVLYVFKSQFIDTAAKFETLAISLEAIEGSSEKAKASLAWITDFAKRTPLELDGVTNAYMLLKNAGIDPTGGSLQALVDQNAKVGGSQDNLIEITRQLGQSWMKNKLQMEEVNVLTERMVPVVGLLARAYGKSEKEIMEAIGKGKIGRQSILKLFRQMGKESEGASEKQSRSWDGMMSTLSDTWEMVKRTMMDAGPFDWLKQRLAGLLDQLNALLSPEGLARLTAFGEQLRQAFEKAERGAVKLWDWINQLAERVGGFGNLARIALGGVAAILAGPLIMGIGAVLLAVTQLTALFLANPILLAIAAIGAAVYVVYTHFDDLKKLWNQVVADIQQGIESTINVFSGWAGVIRDGIGGALQWVKEKLDALVSAFKLIGGLFFDMKSIVPEVKVPSMPVPPISVKPLPETVGPLVVPNGKLPSVSIPSLAFGPLPKTSGPVASPFAGGVSERNNRSSESKPVDVGGTLHIKIDSEGRPHVAAMKPASSAIQFNVDTGPVMAAPQ
jgi:tape measure domain-containing protein